MTYTKAKYLGIFYTFLLTILQGTLFVILLSWLISFNLFEEEIVYFILQGYDFGIPIALIVSWFRGRKIGQYILYGLGKENSIYTLLTTIALTMPILYLTFYVFDFYSHGTPFQVEDIFVMFIFFVCAWIGSFVVFFPSSAILARVLEKLLEWHQR